MMIVRDFPLAAGAILRLARGFKPLALVDGPQPQFCAEVYPGGPQFQHVVLELASGDVIPAGAHYIGSLARAPRKGWGIPRPSDKTGPRHFYICEVGT